MSEVTKAEKATEVPEQEYTDEQAQEFFNDTLRSMTQQNWILLRSRLDMTRQEIQQDAGLLTLAIVWKHEGTTTQNLARMLEQPSGDIEDRLEALVKGRYCK